MTSDHRKRSNYANKNGLHSKYFPGLYAYHDNLSLRSQKSLCLYPYFHDILTISNGPYEGSSQLLEGLQAVICCL